MGPRKNKSRGIHFRLCGQNAYRPGGAANAARLCIYAGHKMAGRIRTFISVPRNARPNEGDHRHENRYGTAAANGSPDLWRCWFWQNGSCSSRGIQGRDGGEASGRARADDCACSATFRSVPAAHARVSGADRNAQPFSFAFRTEKSAARSEEHTSELQSRRDLVCRLLLEKKKKQKNRGEECD